MNTEINNLKMRSLESMKSYMVSCVNDSDSCGYTEENIQECENLIDSFLRLLSETAQHNNQIVMEVVKNTVIALNELNEKCDFSLIETDQREDLAMLIIKAAEVAGVGNGMDDITEEWREW